MADIRENLIEILRKTRYEYRRYIAMKDYEKRMAKTDEEFCAVDDSIVGEIPFCADHLIADGVTIQRWIPVAERLPKGGNGKDVAENVIAYLNNGEVIEQVCTGWCNGDEWWLIVGDEDTHTAWGLGAVTHWMPLPEAPKEE